MGTLDISTQELELTGNSLALDRSLIVDSSSLLYGTSNGIRGLALDSAVALAGPSQNRQSEVGI